jgi:FAD dependent oxidoreductase
VKKVTRAHGSGTAVCDDEIGVTPSLSSKFPKLSIPYACLVPERLDGLLACGRRVSCDANSHSFLREIPQCRMTGQAAGMAAALACNAEVEPRAADVSALQHALLGQRVLLRPGPHANALAAPNRG